MECKTFKVKVNRNKFEVKINDFPFLKETTVTVSKESQFRLFDGRFFGYRYQGTVRRVFKAVNAETRERNISKYLTKFGIKL